MNNENERFRLNKIRVVVFQNLFIQNSLSTFSGLFIIIQGTMSYPVIDISCWIDVVVNNASEVNENMKNVAKQWNTAMCEYGFAVVVGHTITEECFDRLNNNAKMFFELPIEEKMKFNHGKYGHPSGGFSAVGNETVASSLTTTTTTLTTTNNTTQQPTKQPDPVENFVFTSSPSKFRTSDSKTKNPITHAHEYYTHMEHTLHTIHQISAYALGLDDMNYFVKLYDENTDANANMGENGNALRLAHYPPQVVTTTTTHNKDKQPCECGVVSCICGCCCDCRDN